MSPRSCQVPNLVPDSGHSNQVKYGNFCRTPQDQRTYLVEARIQRFCIEAEFQPRIVIQIDQANSIKELIKLGFGISILPLWSVSEEIRIATLQMVRLSKRKVINMTGLIYRKTLHVPAGVRALPVKGRSIRFLGARMEIDPSRASLTVWPDSSGIHRQPNSESG